MYIAAIFAMCLLSLTASDERLDSLRQELFRLFSQWQVTAEDLPAIDGFAREYTQSLMPTPLPTMHADLPDFSKHPAAVVVTEDTVIDKPTNLSDVYVVKGCKLTIAAPVTYGTLQVLGGEIEVLADMTVRNIPIDIERDPSQWGRGIIVMNSVASFLHPEVREPLARTIRWPMRGDVVIELDDATTWRVGDELIVPKTHHETPGRGSSNRHNYSDSEHERRTIVAVSGQSVTLDSPLEHNHRGAVDFSGEIAVYPPVFNVTQPIRLTAEDPSAPGHIAFIGTSQVFAHGVYIRDMGRTRADVAIDNTIYDDNGTPLAIGTNQIARYPWHFHHCRGATQQGDTNYVSIDGGDDLHPFKLWMVAHQSSFLKFRKCFIYNTCGSGYATEDGNERNVTFDQCHIARVEVGHKPEQELRGTGGDAFWLKGVVHCEIRNSVICGAKRSAIWTSRRSLFAKEPVIADGELDTYLPDVADQTLQAIVGCELFCNHVGVGGENGTTERFAKPMLFHNQLYWHNPGHNIYWQVQDVRNFRYYGDPNDYRHSYAISFDRASRQGTYVSGVEAHNVERGIRIRMGAGGCKWVRGDNFTIYARYGLSLENLSNHGNVTDAMLTNVKTQGFGGVPHKELRVLTSKDGPLISLTPSKLELVNFNGASGQVFQDLQLQDYQWPIALWKSAANSHTLSKSEQELVRLYAGKTNSELAATLEGFRPVWGQLAAREGLYQLGDAWLSVK